MEIDPVGRVHTPFETPKAAPRQGYLTEAVGTIELFSPYVTAFEGLDVGEDIDVIWYADEADRSTKRIKDGQKGVFATRSQDRPNPIAITQCTITDVSENRITIEGVDMADGTPVLDIKLSDDC